MDKKDLRQKGRLVAAETQKQFGEDYDRRIAEQFFQTQYFMPRSVISAYMPLRGEVSCTEIAEKLERKGHIVCLPVVLQRDRAMIFRAYYPGDPTKPGVMGQQEPLENADIVIPDILLIPMLGFTRQGYRLGYGTGFYDRTLEELRKAKPVKAIGIAYSAQEVPMMAVEPHDAPLNAIITEKEVIEIK